MAYTHLKTAHVIHEKFELVEFIRFDVRENYLGCMLTKLVFSIYMKF